MYKYIIKRILIAIPVLIGITVIDYAIMCMAGSPLEMMQGPRVSQAGDQRNAHQKQRRPKMACNHLTDCLRGLDRIAQVAMQKLPQPDKVLDIKWFIQSQCDLLCLQRSL